MDAAVLRRSGRRAGGEAAPAETELLEEDLLSDLVDPESDLVEPESDFDSLLVEEESEFDFVPPEDLPSFRLSVR